MGSKGKKLGANFVIYLSPEDVRKEVSGKSCRAAATGGAEKRLSLAGKRRYQVRNLFPLE